MKATLGGSLMVLISLTAPGFTETLKLRAEKVEITTSNDDPQKKEFSIWLTPQGTDKLFAFAAKYDRKVIEIRIAGKLVMTPVIYAPMYARLLPPLRVPFSDTEIPAVKEQLLSSDAIELSPQEP